MACIPFIGSSTTPVADRKVKITKYGDEKTSSRLGIYIGRVASWISLSGLMVAYSGAVQGWLGKLAK